MSDEPEVYEFAIGEHVEVLATGWDNQPIAGRPPLCAGQVAGCDTIDGTAVYDIALTTGGLTRSYGYGLRRVTL